MLKKKRNQEGTCKSLSNMHKCIQVRKQKCGQMHSTSEKGKGPLIVRTLDNALKSFGVQRQQYFGGALFWQSRIQGIEGKVCYACAYE